MSSEAKTVDAGYPEPTTADLEDPAFEAIWQAIKGWDVARDPTGDGLRSGPTGNDVMHILQRLRALPEPSTPAAKAGDGWIRCSERAPAQHGFYLVYHEAHGFDVFLHTGVAWGKSSFFDHEDPTHWMPLPAPPEPGDER